jgi:hypothetical protein
MEQVRELQRAMDGYEEALAAKAGEAARLQQVLDA